MRFPQRAVQIWSVLALAARNRQVLTYDILSELVGVPRQGLGQLIEPIQSYCLLRNLPPLTILVVRQDTGLPGAGFTAAGEIPATQVRVFKHDWRRQACPTTEEFEEAVRLHRSRSVLAVGSGSDA